jgi:hypothetical protein
MAQRLKRWESPRNEGRNDKGKGGSARQRQLKKRLQMLRNKLKEQSNDNNGASRDKKGGNHDSLLFYVPISLPSISPLKSGGCFCSYLAPTHQD